MLAINFNVYEKALDSVSNFFSNWKENLKFILLLGSGLLLSIILCSNIVMYLLNNYFFLTMMMFIGLILGGTYNFSRNIEYRKKDLLIILLVVGLILFISVGNINNVYVIRNNFLDYIVFFIGGMIEIMASIIPGISGTALQMILGIYDNILVMIAKVYDFNFIFNNIGLYISYGIGMIISCIISVLLVNYCLKKYSRISNIVILGLSISSILLLCIMTFSYKFSLLEFIGGLMLMVLGLPLSCIFDK